MVRTFALQVPGSTLGFQHFYNKQICIHFVLTTNNSEAKLLIVIYGYGFFVLKNKVKQLAATPCEMAVTDRSDFILPYTSSTIMHLYTKN